MKKIINNMRTAGMAMMLILALLTTLTVQAAADKTALNAAVSEAETYYGTISESNPKEAEVLKMLIDAAKQVQVDDSFTQSDLEFATAFMKELIVQAKEAVTTGVSAARAASNMAAKYYDLQGRRVSQPTKGIYIRDGKTVVTK